MYETKTTGSMESGSCRIINEGIEIHIIRQLRLNAARDGVTSPMFSVTPLLPDYGWFTPAEVRHNNGKSPGPGPDPGPVNKLNAGKLRTNHGYSITILNEHISEDLARSLARHRGIGISNRQMDRPRNN